MAIEVYAIVVLEPHNSELSNWVAFCHVKLVDGIGKRPRWEVVERLIKPRFLKGNPKRYADPNGLLDRRRPGIALFPPTMRIGDRRITLTQLRHIFPECATMPLGIALDYVRDRI
jgi:hypothetical protein